MAEYTKENVVAWLNQHWRNTACPICQNNNWSISDTPVELRPYQGGGLIVGGPVYPLFSVTCNVCGHTLLFNALVARLVAREPAREPASASIAVPESEKK